MFIKHRKTTYYCETNKKIEDISLVRTKDENGFPLGRKVIKFTDGEEMTLWSVSPLRVAVLDFIFGNPRSSPSKIKSQMQLPHLQSVSDSIKALRDDFRLIYKEDYSNYSIVPEKKDEIQSFLNSFRAMTLPELDLNKLKEE